MIIIENGIVKRDGEPVGNVVDNQVQVAKGLHHKVKAAIASIAGLPVVEVDSLPASDSDEPIRNEKEEPEPPQDHRGDKTPDWVEWLHRNRPEEAEQRYANRVISR